jgi:E3 ubiquitin-protein ligase TRIP12
MSIKDEDVVMGSDDEWVDENEDEALVRMGERYRAMSEHRRGSFTSEDGADEAQNNDNDEEDDQNNDDMDDNENNANEEEDENPLLGAFRQLANAHRNGVPARSVIENMARMFPESMMFGGNPGGGTRLDSYIDAINSREDPYLTLDTINELSERLLMMNALDAERGVPHHQLSKALISVLDFEPWQEHMELQIVACRCLYNLLEIEPSYCRSAIESGVIKALQAKLMEISFIDVAEQALQTLEFISRFQGYFVLRKQCLPAVLMYLDFFTIHAQRKAVRIVANSVKHVKPDDIDTVLDIFPTLQRIVIEFTDSQELETCWLAISSIIKNFAKSSHLEKIVTPELLDKILQVISTSDTTLSTALRLIHTLSICAQNSNLSVEIIRTGKVSDSLIAILSKYQKGNGPDSISIETLMSVPKDLTLSILKFIALILPCEKEPVLTRPDEFAKDYSEVQNEYKQLGNQIFILLINIYSATVVSDIRLLVLICLLRLIASFRDLTRLKDRFLIVNLLASIIIQNKSIIRTEKQDVKPYLSLLGALALSNSLITNDPETFITEFEREGLLTDTSSLLEILRQDERKIVDTQMLMAQEEYEEDNQESNGEDDDEQDEDDGGDDDEDEDDFLSDEDLQDRQETIHVASQQLIRPLGIVDASKLLARLASGMEQTYLSRKACNGSKLENLRLLDELSGDLREEKIYSGYSKAEWSAVWNNLHDALMKDSYVVSSFELISSGIIEVLATLFKDDQFGSESSLARTTFLKVFQGEALETLVKKLQESLTRSESFAILGCGLKTGENRAASLGKQLKIKLKYLSSEDDDDPLFEDPMSTFVILVHAIASFNNISSFLKRRLGGSIFFGPVIQQHHLNDWYLEFLLDGEVIPLETTIYGALYNHLRSKNPNFDTNRFWHEVHQVEFRKVKGIAPYIDIDERYSATSEEELELLNQNATIGILNLLKVLHDFNSGGDNSLFLNFKLTAKLNRQLEEPLIVASGILPNWSIHITRTFPFLFPLETRIFFLQSTSFGYSRLIQLWGSKAAEDNNNANSMNSDRGNNSNSSASLGRATRHKVRVSRNHLLKSAYKVLDKLGSHPSILEFEFIDEVGTGLGPTLEFYSNVCHGFAEKSIGLWRDNNNDSSDHVHSELGLFPAPISASDPEFSKRLSHFNYLGKFVARALLDNRILDFAFNPFFFELCAYEIEQHDVKFGLDKLKQVDPKLHQSLEYLQKHRENVDSLGINFTVPGYGINLLPNGEDRVVTNADVDEYIDLVVDWVVNRGVKDQIENFVIGFTEVFPYYSMLIFSPYELVQLFGQSAEDWSYETLISCIHADHGYHIDSKTVQNLIKLMMSYSQEERRSFLKFLTGAPRLPIGGFKNLKPEFTVVLKRAEEGCDVDDYLPSVMTCANYLKLPDYSSSEVLQSKMFTAMNDGAGAFLLS